MPSARISAILSPAMCSDFVPLAGDRAFADDQAILGGFATIGGRQGHADRP